MVVYRVANIDRPPAVGWYIRLIIDEVRVVEIFQSRNYVVLAESESSWLLSRRMSWRRQEEGGQGAASQLPGTVLCYK